MAVQMNITECGEALLTLNTTIATLQSQIEECGCNADPCASTVEGDRNLPLHIGAVFIILVCSLAGVMLPIVARRLKLRDYPLVLGKHFGTGIIITCAFIHMLLPANEALTNKCLGPAFTEDFSAYAYLFCIISIFSMHGLERGVQLLLSTPKPQPTRKAKPGPSQKLEEHSTSNAEALADPSEPDCESHPYAHNHGAMSEGSDLSLSEIRLQAYMLEFGFTFHSIFIGLAVGVENENLIPLLTALSFHQFFEGIGLGSRLSEDGISTYDAVVLGCIFAVAAPIGIMVGTIVTTELSTGGSAFLLSQGIIDAICAGILVYVGFILLFSDFPRDIKRVCVGEKRGWKALGLYICMWTGAGLMAFIGRFL